MMKNTHGILDPTNDCEVKWYPSEHQARQAATEMITEGSKTVWVFELVATYRRNPQPAIEESKTKVGA